MFLHFKNLLTAAEIATVREIAGKLKFADGRASNPHNTSKENLQADFRDADSNRASTIAATAINRSAEVMDFLFMKRMALPLLHRYDVGMKYGSHADAAFIPLQPPLRSDISATIWLGDPSSYEGGELIVHLGTETIRMKGDAGSAIFYPSTTLHEVTPVTSGSRLVFITFIESQVQDANKRDLLYALNEIHALEGLKMKWDNRVRLQHVSQNLHRMWAQ